MENTEITWEWEMLTPFHIGSGFSRAGFADRTVRLENGYAVIPSSAVKGAIRGSAEQLSHWLGSKHEESETESLPRDPLLRRIFAPDEQRNFYHFCGCRSRKPVAAYTFSSTKINRETRSAEDNTLRTIEILPRGIHFEGRIQLLAGDWHNAGSPEAKDVLFLAAALAATESIGGKKGAGLGRLRCRNLKIGGRSALPLLMAPNIFGTLQAVIPIGDAR